MRQRCVQGFGTSSRGGDGGEFNRSSRGFSKGEEPILCGGFGEKQQVSAGRGLWRGGGDAFAQDERKRDSALWTFGIRTLGTE